MDNDLRELELRVRRDPSRTNVLKLIRAMVRTGNQLRTFFIPYIVPYQTRLQDIFNFGFIVVGPLAFEPILDKILETKETGLTNHSYETTSESIRHGLSCKIYPFFQTEEERNSFLRAFIAAMEAACEFTPLIRDVSEFGWEPAIGPQGSRDRLQKRIFRSHIVDSLHRPKIVLTFRTITDRYSARYSDITIFLPFSWIDGGREFFNHFFGPWPVEIDPRSGGPRRWREWEPGVFIDNPLQGDASQHLSRGPSTLAEALKDVQVLKKLVDERFQTDSEVVINDLSARSRRNPDENLRSLQRRALSGDVAAGVGFLLAKYRAGTLDPHNKILRLAAHLGHPVAVKFYQQTNSELNLFFSVLFRSIAPSEPDPYEGFRVEETNIHRASEHLAGSAVEMLEMTQEQRLQHFQGIWWFFIPILYHHTDSGELYLSLFNEYSERHSKTFLRRADADQIHALNFLREPELYNEGRGFLIDLLWKCLWTPSSTPEGEERVPRWADSIQIFIRQMFSTRASEVLAYRRDALDFALFELDLTKEVGLYHLGQCFSFNLPQ